MALSLTLLPTVNFKRTSAAALCACLAMLVAAGNSGSARAEESPEDEREEIARLVEQLDHDEYYVREAPAGALRERGEACREALLVAAKSPSAELRTRAERLLVLIQAEALDRQIQDFLAFKTPAPGAIELVLPGWERFHKRFEDGPAQRKFYMEIYKHDPELLAAYDQGAKAVDAHVQHMIQHWNQGHEQFLMQASLGMLVVSSDMEHKLSHSSDIQMCSVIIRAYPALKAREGDPLFRRIFSAWMQAEGAHPNVTYQKIHFAMQHNIAEGLKPALALIETKQQNGAYVGYAILAVGKLGGLEHQETLESLLEDATVMMNMHVNNEVRQVTVGDVALATLAYLHQEDLKDYGFEQAQTIPDNWFHPHTLHRTADARAKGLAKWRENHPAEKKEEEKPAGDGEAAPE